MAAALFRHALAAQDAPLRDLEVVSAGVSAVDGCPPSANTTHALKKVGLSLENHRSKHLTQAMLDQALAVFCMTEAHRAMVEIQFDVSKTNIHLMREFVATDDQNIPDPFGSNLQSYEACRDSMVEAVPSLLEYLRKLLRVS